MDANAEASSMIRQYGSMFLHHRDLQMTVKYYAQAAVTVGRLTNITLNLQERELVMEQETILRELEAILSIHMLGRQGNHLDALREIAKLPFLHLDPRVPDAAADVFQSASLYFQTCVPDLLKVALTWLDIVPDTDGSVHAMRSKIAGFLASNTPADLYEKGRDVSNSPSSEPKLQEQQNETLLRKIETLKCERERLQIMHERLHGESCKRLSFPELKSLQSQLCKGRLNMRIKMEEDKLVKQEKEDSYLRQLEFSKKRKILRLGAKDRRRFYEEIKQELAPVQMKKKIKYLKREVKRLRLLNEIMIGNKLEGMSYYELMAYKREILCGLVSLHRRMRSLMLRPKEEELETVELDTMQPGDFIIKYCSKLGMSQHAVKAAKEAVVKCEEIDRRVVAVVLYIITQLSDDKKSLKEISTATGVAEGTIRKPYKDLYPHFPKIAPSWYAKEEDLKNLSSP